MMNGCARWSFLAVPLLAALGCSDPVPRPAQGGVTLSIEKSNATCPVPGKTYEVCHSKGHGPTNAAAGDRLIDGESGASIKCSVKGNGPYSFSGNIHGLSTENELVTVTITNGVISADKTTGTGTVNVYTPTVMGFISAEGTCVFNVVNQQVKGGSLWATFSCPSITQASTSQVCAVGTTSAIVFENCDGS